MTRLDRRTFLRASGVAVALPMLESMSPPRRALGAAPERPRRRMVLIDIGLGLHGPNLFPEQAGRDYEMTPYLEVIREFRDDFTIISGCSHPDVDGGHHAAKSFLTAAPKPTGANFKNTISLDQLAAEQIGLQTRFPSLTLSLTPGRGLSYSRSGAELPSESRPSQLFARLFLEGKPEEKRRQVQRLKDGQSVMDAVLDNARRMQRRLGLARSREARSVLQLRSHGRAAAGSGGSVGAASQAARGGGAAARHRRQDGRDRPGAADVRHGPSRAADRFDPARNALQSRDERGPADRRRDGGLSQPLAPRPR
jgi:hypothetical protein